MKALLPSAFFLLAGAACLAPLSAEAQTARFDDTASRDGLFTRNLAVSVLERPHPDYAPVPVTLNSFVAYPTLGVDLAATDNVFATPNGEADIAAHFLPAVRVQSTWSRNSLQLFGRGDAAGYSRNSSQNELSGTVGFNARRDIARGDSLQFGGSFGREVEDRTAVDSTLNLGVTDPITFERAVAYAGGTWSLNRLRFTAQANYEGRRFDDVGSLSLKFRNIDIIEGEGRAEYALNPSLAGFVSVSANHRNALVDLPALPQRDSTGYTVEGGVDFESGALWRGEVGLGYLSQNFKNRAYVDTDGLSVHARVEYFPTQLTSLSLNVARGVNEPGVAVAGGFLYTQAAAEVDHELLRNVILTGRLTRQVADYVGVDRTDSSWSTNLGVSYLMNRAASFDLDYRHYDRTSDGVATGRSFIVNSLTAGLTYRY